jgi:hypothetical protein
MSEPTNRKRPAGCFQELAHFVLRRPRRADSSQTIVGRFRPSFNDEGWCDASPTERRGNRVRSLSDAVSIRLQTSAVTPVFYQTWNSEPNVGHRFAPLLRC